MIIDIAFICAVNVLSCDKALDIHIMLFVSTQREYFSALTSVLLVSICLFPCNSGKIEKLCEETREGFSITYSNSLASHRPAVLSCR